MSDPETQSAGGLRPASAIRLDVLTIFPGMFAGPLDQSILQRARDAGLIEVYLHDLRDWAHDRHRTVDDYPFGGGAGMVMKPDPIFEAIEAIQPLAAPPAYVVFPGPQGRPLDRALVQELAARPRLLLLCGRYEGVDERVLEHAVDLEVSIGDFVVSGGELPTMLLIDAITRRIPGVLGGEGSLEEESFEDGLLEYPQYTRPAEFRDWTVPDILLSGHHAQVANWRRRQRLLRTAQRRPELLQRALLAPDERAAVSGDPGFAQVRTGNTIFQARVAAVAVSSDGRVLLHRTAGDSVWTLPGGRVRVGERIEDAVRRELQEEAGIKVQPGEILWVREDFFERASAVDGPGRGETLTHHEIGIYVAVTVPSRLERRKSFVGQELGGTNHEFALEFRWFTTDALYDVDLRPREIVGPLRERMLNSDGDRLTRTSEPSDA